MYGNNITSIIMTSGTLSPLESFESELETKFDIKLINKHVIQTEQVKMMVLDKGANWNQFRFTFEDRKNTKMIIDLGISITEILKITPDGVLIFFSSYAPYLKS